MATGEGQTKKKAGKGAKTKTKEKVEVKADKPLKTRQRGKRRAAKHSQPGWKAKTADALLAVLVRQPATNSNSMSLQHVLGYTFRDPKLLEQALTHASANKGPHHNGRLAWLGDAVLKLIVSELLFHAQLGSTSGELTRARNLLEARHMCAHLGSKLGIGELLRQGRGGQPATPGMEAEAVEALLGAVYLDSGLNVGTVKQVYVVIGQLGAAGQRVDAGGSQVPAQLGGFAEDTPRSAPLPAAQQHEQEQLFFQDRPTENQEMEGQAGGSQGTGSESRGWWFRWRQVSGAGWLPEWLRWQ